MLKITIDTREQMPWSFPPHLASVQRGTLKSGDYALDGDGKNFAIERKSLNDLVGTLSTGWERFERELVRMQTFPVRCIIVEGSWSQVLDHEYEAPLVQPNFLRSRICNLVMDDVHVLFADNAQYAAFLAWGVLKARWDRIVGEIFKGEGVG